MRTSRDMSPWYAWSKTIWTKGFIIIESRGAPFYICIWRLKRQINSQFSIQSTLWFSGDDEVNGTESASSHFLGVGFLLNLIAPCISMRDQAAQMNVLKSVHIYTVFFMMHSTLDATPEGPGLPTKILYNKSQSSPYNLISAF